MHTHFYNHNICKHFWTHCIDLWVVEYLATQYYYYYYALFSENI